MKTTGRTTNYGVGALEFVLPDGRVYARLFFPSPTTSDERDGLNTTYQRYAREWIERGVWPLAASVASDVENANALIGSAAAAERQRSYGATAHTDDVLKGGK